MLNEIEENQLNHLVGQPGWLNQTQLTSFVAFIYYSLFVLLLSSPSLVADSPQLPTVASFFELLTKTLVSWPLDLISEFFSSRPWFIICLQHPP